MALWVWFSTGGVSGELGGWLGHLAASLLLLALSHFFLILCSSLLYKLERCLNSLLPRKLPREFLLGFSESRPVTSFMDALHLPKT